MLAFRVAARWTRARTSWAGLRPSRAQRILADDAVKPGVARPARVCEQGFFPNSQSPAEAAATLSSETQGVTKDVVEQLCGDRIVGVRDEVRYKRRRLSIR